MQCKCKSSASQHGVCWGTVQPAANKYDSLLFLWKSTYGSPRGRAQPAAMWNDMLKLVCAAMYGQRLLWLSLWHSLVSLSLCLSLFLCMYINIYSIYICIYTNNYLYNWPIYSCFSWWSLRTDTSKMSCQTQRGFPQIVNQGTSAGWDQCLRLFGMCRQA